jgi:threonylcarbamoyladenosine tRNA methylthiotransferase MtaB
MLGCACKCTYCAIRFAIGPIQSRPIADILEDIRNGILQGYRNIRLEGDSLGSYGLDIDQDLGELLDAVLDEIKDKKNIQIGVPDISPRYLDKCQKQIIRLAHENRLFNFYIPIQSGSQKVIDLMKRGYQVTAVKKQIMEIQKACPDIKFGTSLIIGFPGETEEDFKKTIDICKEIKFDYIYCHSYSDRKGTEASNLPGKISSETILNRSRIFKSEVISVTPNITIAEDTKGNRSCQG